jgi:3-methyladenine DNA glycosylase/8-oxoguanine DNA glycosylase
MEQCVWKLDEPFDLRRTLRFALPKATGSARLGGSRSVFALHTGDGPATVAVTLREPRLTARAVGPGAAAALQQSARTLGMNDHPADFAPPPGPVRELHRRYRGLRLGSTGRIFDTLLPTILDQRVTIGESNRSYRQILYAFGEVAPGDEGLYLAPRPEVIAALSYVDLHRFGVERSRAEIAIEAARRAIRLEEIVGMPRAAAVRRLQAINGIGPWTTGLVMGSAWGDRDAVPVGDFHLPHTVSWLLERVPRSTDERMLQLLEPYRPHRRRAVILLKLSGVVAPRYGPRSRLSTISKP